MSLTLWLLAAPPATPSEKRGLARSERAALEAARAQLEAQGVRFERLLHAPTLGSLASAHFLVPLVDVETVCEPRLVVGPLDALLTELEGLTRAGVIASPPRLARLAALLVCGSEREAARFELAASAPIACVGAPRPGAMRVTGLRPPTDALPGE